MEHPFEGTRMVYMCLYHVKILPILAHNTVKLGQVDYRFSIHASFGHT